VSDQNRIFTSKVNDKRPQGSGYRYDSTALGPSDDLRYGCVQAVALQPVASIPGDGGQVPKIWSR